MDFDEINLYYTSLLFNLPFLQFKVNVLNKSIFNYIFQTYFIFLVFLYVSSVVSIRILYTLG